MSDQLIDLFNKELQDEKFAELIAKKVVERLVEVGVFNDK
jgi:hypothetical protein